MEGAAFEEGHSLDTMRKDFAARKAGVVSFTYSGIKETMCYVPVRGTDWMLTYLVRESVITNQISSISDGIVRRSLMQSVLTALVLAGIVPSRKGASLKAWLRGFGGGLDLTIFSALPKVK